MWVESLQSDLATTSIHPGPFTTVSLILVKLGFDHMTHTSLGVLLSSSLLLSLYKQQLHALLESSLHQVAFEYSLASFVILLYNGFENYALSASLFSCTYYKAPAHSPVKAPVPAQVPVKAPATIPPVKPPVLPAPPVNEPPTKPPPTTRIECIPLCVERCKLHSRKRLCLRACLTCCDRCKCVPPGTYGNRQQCGKCHTDMATHGGKFKCP
ncbi:hypothetical protein ACSBR2_010496 [Camellia fascicularis]